MHDPYLDSIDDDSCREMRTASGRVDSTRPIVTFLYLLGRDKLSLGDVEELVSAATVDRDGPTMFTNGWLARWAEYTADRLEGRDPRDVLLDDFLVWAEGKKFSRIEAGFIAYREDVLRAVAARDRSAGEV